MDDNDVFWVSIKPLFGFIDDLRKVYKWSGSMVVRPVIAASVTLEIFVSIVVMPLRHIEDPILFVVPLIEEL